MDRYFETARLNRIFGFLLGVVNAIPQLSWSIDHALSPQNQWGLGTLSRGG
jgi:omega-6 fatty acid desaturase (delta-12 desaturase)